MTRTNLLSAVLSPNGWYCVVGLKKTGHPKQLFVETLADVERETDDLLAHGYDVYFACAKYENAGSRANDNVKDVMSFWMDIDCEIGRAHV